MSVGDELATGTARRDHEGDRPEVLVDEEQPGRVGLQDRRRRGRVVVVEEAGGRADECAEVADLLGIEVVAGKRLERSVGEP